MTPQIVSDASFYFGGSQGPESQSSDKIIWKQVHCTYTKSWHLQIPSTFFLNMIYKQNPMLALHGTQFRAD